MGVGEAVAWWDGLTFGEKKEIIRESARKFSSPDYKCHPITRVSIRGVIGRNDPCHCGSGKKYKKCCRS